MRRIGTTDNVAGRVWVVVVASPGRFEVRSSGVRLCHYHLLW